LRKSKGVEGFVEIEKHLESMSDTDLWTEEHLFFLSAWYGAVKNQGKADYYKTKSQEKFPAGRWVQREEAGQFYKKVGSDEKRVFLDDFETKYPEYSGFSYMRGVLIGEYIKEGFHVKAFEYFQSLKGKLWSERPIFYAVNNINKIGKDDGRLLMEIIHKSVVASRKEYENPSNAKPPLKISSIWDDARAMQFALALDAFGLVTSLIGSSSDALPYMEEAYQLTKKEHKQINEHFAVILLKNGSTEEAKEILEKSIGSGIQSAKMEEILKEIFKKTNGVDLGFASYFAKLKTKALGSLKDEIKAKLITEKAPDFTLLDTDGKEISLSDYNGKIVILDFWATWCGPCKASFPAMKKAQNKYKKSNDVKILFVNTRETTKNKLQTVVELMSNNDYPFHVLMDDNDEVYQSFGVSLLPTKVIIDKEGNIRYRSLGFLGETELLDELDALISIFNSEKRTMDLSG
jgi:peroxiredoxin